MREVSLPPFAPAMLDSMRAIGYSFEAALADIVDNSIAADARHVEIQFRPDPPYVALLDDGYGMSGDELVEAMRHGGLGPHESRSERDLGRFGLGLKTASLSQCRRLTVMTRQNGEVVGARWDLDRVAQKQDWILSLLDPEDMQELPHASELASRPSGTLVVWEGLDRALAGEVNPGAALGKLIDYSRDHLALAFHRFTGDETPDSQLEISINNRSLPRIDPFLSKKRSTRHLPPEDLQVAGATVSFRPYILPHISKMSRDDLELAGGEEGLRRHQGFYVYRGRRLITHGTWFRLLRQGELTKLARVQVDIPNSLDHLWALDVKKSTAYPPEAVRAGLLRTIERIAGESRHVYTFRGKKISRGQLQHLWQRVDVRGGFNYEINRDHPVVLESSVPGPGSSRSVEPLLRAIEMALPVDSIYVDMASDRVVQTPPGDDEAFPALLAVARQLWDAVAENREARNRLLEGGFMEIDLFAAHPKATTRIVRTLRNDS